MSHHGTREVDQFDGVARFAGWSKVLKEGVKSAIPADTEGDTVRRGRRKAHPRLKHVRPVVGQPFPECPESVEGGHMPVTPLSLERLVRLV